MTNWTRVDNRLPEHNQFVAVIYLAGNYGVTYWRNSYWDADGRSSTVKYWTPLPPPPDERDTSGGASSGRETESDGGE